MLAKYFKKSVTLEKFYSGIAGTYLDDFILWLEKQGYRRITIRVSALWEQRNVKPV